MKQSILYLSIAACFACSITSCKKDDNNKTNNNARETQIVGTFKLTATGEDANNNNVLDVGENDLIPAGSSLIEVFRADKTGSVYSVLPGNLKDTSAFTYSFINNYTQLQIVSGTTTGITQIITLNSTVLVGYDVSTNPHRIYAFVRQ